jgi:peroxiredoxin
LEQSYIPDWKKTTIKEQIKIILKNKIGTKAADILLKDPTNQSHLLSTSKAEFTLLYFYDPDCHSCAKATPMVKQWVEMQKNIMVWGIYIEQDKENWQKYLETNQSPINWINLWDEKGKSNLREKYWIDGIPAMYLLDKNKKVILKNANFNQLKAFFAKQ